MEWSAFVVNILVFIVLVGVIVLSSYNIATYSDILNGNTNAPDIDSGECTAMIWINSILIVAAVLAIFFFIYRLIGEALNKLWLADGGLDGAKSESIGGIEKTSTINPKKTDYIANTKRTQMVLWLISTFIFTASVLNILNVIKLRNGSDSNAVSPGAGFLAVSIIFSVVTGLFFLYTTFRALIPKEAAYDITFKSLFTAAQTPLVVTKCDCPPKTNGPCNMTLKEFNKGTKLDMHYPIIPSSIVASKYNNK
jgi:hypothetical protein